MAKMKGLTIGALAREAGVNVETIRYYERRGLLAKPARPESGYRQYPQETITRLLFIKRAQALGFSLKEIGELLSLEIVDINCAKVLALTQRKILDIESKICSLTAIKLTLSELATNCPGEGSLSLCPIWHRLETNGKPKEVSYMAKRKVEVFTAGCPVCSDLVELVKSTACPDCQVTIYNLNQGQGVEEAKRYGITAVPSVVVECKLLDCCQRAHPTVHDLRAAGIGQPFKK
jgi:MerR family copper efflux transcriptional regulator